METILVTTGEKYVLVTQMDSEERFHMQNILENGAKTLLKESRNNGGFEWEYLNSVRRGEKGKLRDGDD